jgi:hypothetical protein
MFLFLPSILITIPQPSSRSSGLSTVDELDPAAHPPGGVFVEGEPLNNPAEGPLFVWLFALAVVAAVDFSVVLPTQYDYIKKVRLSQSICFE